MQAKPALGLLSYIPQPKVESLVTPFSLNVGSAINMGQFFLASQGTASRHIEAQISEESLPSPCHRTGRMGKCLSFLRILFMCGGRGAIPERTLLSKVPATAEPKIPPVLWVYMEAEPKVSPTIHQGI